MEVTSNKDESKTPRADVLIPLLFVPGVYLVLIFSAVVALIIGGGLIGIIYYVFAHIFGRIPVGILLLLGLGVLVCFYAVLKGIISTIWRKPKFEPAVLIDLDREPNLKNIITHLCGQMNTKVPKSVIIHALPTFYVQQGSLRVFNGKAKGRTLAIGLPLLYILSTNEFRAILAHEFAHFTGRDTVYSSFVLPVYTGVIAATSQMQSIIESAGEDNDNNSIWMSLPLLIPYYFLNTYLNIFHKKNMKLSKEREFRADDISAKTCGYNSFSNGLKKVVAVSGPFQGIYEYQIIETLKEGKVYNNYYSYFGDNIDKMASLFDESLDTALKRSKDELSSHPTLSERLSSAKKYDEKYEINDETANNLIIDLDSYGNILTDNYTHLVAIINGYTN